MEYLEELSIKRDEKSEFIQNIKDLQKCRFDTGDLEIKENNSKISEEAKSENSKNNLNNKVGIKYIEKYNILNTQIFKNKELYSKQNKLNEKNFDNLLILCNYDIFSYARHGYYKELEKLFLEGVNPDSKDKYGNTLLIISAQNNNKKILKICLRYGAQINMQNLMGNTALHFAKEYGYDEIFVYLIRKGADPHIKNFRGIPAKYGLYRIDDNELFLGKGLKYSNNLKNFFLNKYKKFDENIVDDIK